MLESDLECRQQELQGRPIEHIQGLPGDPRKKALDIRQKRSISLIGGSDG